MRAPLRPVFLAFGDSITQRGWSPAGGWLARLADLYGRRVDVVNRGYSGYNTFNALQLAPLFFPPLVLHDDAPSSAAAAQPSQPPPALVSIFFGANDAALPDGGSKRQHVCLASFEANVEVLARAALAAGVASVLLVAPPPVDEPARVVANVEKGPGYEKPERSNAVAKEYAAAVGRVAAKLATELGGAQPQEKQQGAPGACSAHRSASVAFLDTHAVFSACPEWRGLLSDGLHFSPAGDEAFFEAVVGAIDARFPHLAKDAIPYDTPEWFDIDAAHPAASFARLYE